MLRAYSTPRPLFIHTEDIIIFSKSIPNECPYYFRSQGDSSKSIAQPEHPSVGIFAIAHEDYV